MKKQPLLNADFVIPSDSIVRVKEMGNVVEIQYSEKRSLGGYITKLDKDNYVDNRTGEVKECCHSDNRAEGVENVEKSLSKLRDVINTNVVDTTRCRWLTLTYAENIQDETKLRYDFGHFNTRCRAKFGRYEYIAVAEPQGRGAWHLHIILIFPCRAPYMENALVRKLWGHGFVSVRKLDDVDNVGAYLTAYLGDMEVGEYQRLYPGTDALGEIKEITATDEDGNVRSKRFIKGARLPLYPTGFHLFRCSRGIKRPQKEYMRYAKARTMLGDAALTYKRNTQLIDEDASYSNIISRKIYNKLRKYQKEDSF